MKRRALKGGLLIVLIIQLFLWKLAYCLWFILPVGLFTIVFFFLSYALWSVEKNCLIYLGLFYFQPLSPAKIYLIINA